MTLISELLYGCKESNKIVKQAVSLETLMDIKSWLLPQTEELHNHSNPHIFLFYRDKDGNAEMKYKRWCNDSWEPRSENPGLKLLKVQSICE